MFLTFLELLNQLYNMQKTRHPQVVQFSVSAASKWALRVFHKKAPFLKLFNHPASVLNLEASFTQFFLIQELMIFLQTSVKVLRSKVNVLIFLGLSQKECVCYVCYVCYVTCVTLCGTHPKMTPRDILICLAGLI